MFTRETFIKAFLILVVGYSVFYFMLYVTVNI